MADLPILKFAGLYTSANEFSATPEGALIQADDVVIRSQGVIESRRGQRLSGSFGSANSRVAALFNFGDSVIAQYNFSGALANDGGELCYSEDPDSTNFAGFTGTHRTPEPTLGRMRAVEAGQNFHFTTSNGPYVLDSISSTPRLSGVIRAASPTVTLSASTGTWMADDTAVAYRVVWGIMDAHGTMHLGEPSGRAILLNGSGDTKDAVVNIPIPDDITTSHFFRIYRSETAVTSATEPSDELYLVYENQPTSANITAGYVEVSDITPEILLSDPLYTNPSQPGGILQANGRAPKCRDIAEWGGRVWYANTERLQNLTFSLLAPPVLGDAIVVMGQHYKYETSLSAVDGWLVDYTTLGGSPTDSQKIQYAAQQLVYAINFRNAPGSSVGDTGFIRAYYISGPNDPPGKIYVEALSYSDTKSYLGVSGNLTTTEVQPIATATVAVDESNTSRTGSTVTVTTAAAHGFSTGDSVVMVHADVGGTFSLYRTGGDTNFPAGVKVVASTPNSTTFTYTEAGAAASMSTSAEYHVYKAIAPAGSNNDRAQNRLYFSKFQEPEAVPALNYLDVGSKNSAIYRIVPLRDRLYVFKPEGIYVVSGDYPFRVDLLDATSSVVAADSVAAVGGSIYAFTNQGVVAVSDAGVKIVSRPIERTLLQSEAFTQKEPTTFGVGYESERLYILFLGNSSNAYCEEAYAYCYLTNSWTRWPIERSCAVVGSDDRLYLGHVSDNVVWSERKDFAATDFVDEEDPGVYTVVSKTSNTVFTLSSVPNPEPSPGDGVIIGGTVYGIVESHNNKVVTLRAVGAGTFADSDSVVFYRAIPCNIEWAAQAPGGLDKIKQFPAATYHFRRNDFVLAEGTFATELSTSEQSPDITFSNYTFTGTGSWESRALPKNKRILVPRPNVSAYLAAGFKISEAWSIWALNGITIHHEDVGDGNSR